MSDDKVKAAAIEAFNRYLSQNKLRKTPERYAILEKVFDLNEHFSVESLHEALHSDGYHVSCTTVYNTLELLAEAALVRRRNFGGQTAQYEKISGLTNHHHLVCTRCGRVKEVKDQTLDATLSSLRFGTFRPAYTDLYIYGVCSRCSKKRVTPNNKNKTNKTTEKRQHK